MFISCFKKSITFFLLGQRKIGKRIIYVPVIVRSNKKFRYVLNWLVRQLKGRSNVIGVKKEDVLNLMLEAYNNKGSAVNLKKEFFDHAMAYRFNFRRRGYDKRVIAKWDKEKKEQEEKKWERTLLLSIMLEEEIEEYLRKKSIAYNDFFYKYSFKKKIKILKNF